MKKPEKPYQYSYQELSAFCLQIGLLLEAAVPLDEGLAIMAEAAGCEDEKQLLLYMAEGAELGDPFFKVLEDAGTFPLYVVRMAKLGQQSGTLDQMMKSLSDYYEKEYRLLVNVKNALTYPIMMVVMLLVVLFVLFSKVMPVFDQVYEQLGAKMSPAARSAIRLGGLFSGAALIAAAVIGSGRVRNLGCVPVRTPDFPGGQDGKLCKMSQPHRPCHCKPPVHLLAGAHVEERHGV